VALAAFVGVRLLVLLAVAAAAREQGRDVHHLLVKWDARWYAGIAENGYGFTRVDEGRLLSDYAFFPLFPWLEGRVSAVTGLESVDAGLLISAVSSVAAAWGIFAVADHLYGARVGIVATVLWAALPVGVVQSMAYTESLLTACAAWSMYSVLTGRWVAAGVLASLAGLTRPTGAAVVAAVVVAAAVHYVHQVRPDGPGRSHLQRDLRPPALAVLVAPLGLVGYLSWVGVEVGSATGYFDVASGWGNSFDGGANFAQWIAALLTGPAPVTGVLVVLGVTALVGLYWLCLRQRQPLPLLVLGGLLVVLALTSSGYFGSKPRYLIPAFPLVFPVARWVAARNPWERTAILVVLTVLAAGYGAVWLLGDGPP
jgi:hypothetical protein